MKDKMNRYKMKQLIGILAIVTLSFTSCANEEKEMSGKNTHTLTLTYNIPDATTATRAASYIEASGNESTVDGLHLLFFDADTHGNGAFVASASATLKDADLKQNRISVSLPIEIEEEKEYSVLVIANLAKYTTNPATYLATFNNKTYGRAKEDLQMTFPLNGDNKYYFPDGYLPMSGTTVKPKGKNEINVDLLRAAVRIDVAVGEELEDAELKHAELRNIAPVIPLFRTQTETALPRVDSEQFEVTNNEVTGGLYAIETYLDVADKKKLIEEATCLLVNIYDPNVHQGTDTDKTWYRINLNVDADNIQYLKRNNAYRVVITDITGPGFPTSDDAYNVIDMSLSLVTVTIEWDSMILSGGGTSENGQNYYEFQ